MNFEFTEEQSMLRQALSAYLNDTCSFEKRQALVRSQPDWRPEIWRGLVDLGILGASFPEALGGTGGGAIENLIVMEESGKVLSIEPYLETVVIGGGFLQRARGSRAEELARGIVAGEVVLAFAHTEPHSRQTPVQLQTTASRSGSHYLLNGHKAVVIAAPWATHLIVTAHTPGAPGVSAFVIDRRLPGITTCDYPTVDGRVASDIYFENVRLDDTALLTEEGAALPLIEQVIDEATAAVCAEALGVMRELHQRTLEYSRQRKQFGRRLGEFQVLQHRMVDMLMHLEQSISATYVATLRLGQDPRERAAAVSAAKAIVTKACAFIGQGAIQIHGGIGLAEEFALGHYFKRATVIEGLFGSVDDHLRRYAQLSFNPRALPA
jgi:alkylation response protein AidB-like acyl-CoA dehydrogenase